MTDMIPKQLTFMENISVTGYMSQKIMECNRSEKYRYLGPLAARVGGFAILFFAALADVCIHSALALGKGIAVIPLKPFQRFLQCPDELDFGSPLVHLIEMSEKLPKVVLLPLLCLIDPERACREGKSKEEKQEISDIENQIKNEEEKIVAKEATPYRTATLNIMNNRQGSPKPSPIKMPASPKKATPAKLEELPSHEETTSPQVQPKNLLSDFVACEEQPIPVENEIPKNVESANPRPVPDTPKRALNRELRRADSRSRLLSSDDINGFEITLKREIEGKKIWAKTQDHLPLFQYHKYIKYFIEYMDALINDENYSLESELSHFSLHEILMKSDIKKISEIEKLKVEKLQIMLKVYQDLYKDLDKFVKEIIAKQKDLDAQAAAEAAKKSQEISQTSKAEQEKQERLQKLLLKESVIEDSKKPSCFAAIQTLICEDTKNRLTTFEIFKNLLDKIISDINNGGSVDQQEEKDCLSIVEKLNREDYKPKRKSTVLKK